MKQLYKPLAIAIVAILLIGVGVYAIQPPKKAEIINPNGEQVFATEDGQTFLVEDEPQISLGGGLSQYNATTTLEGGINADYLITTGFGTLGSVIVTLAGDAKFALYDATTTNINLRTGNKATSSILIADFPANLAAGVYEFNAIFDDGLYFDVKSGTLGTSTITWNNI